MDALIVLLPGDGIGVEVTAEAVRVLERVAQKFGHQFTFREAVIGGAAIDATGEPFPAATAQACHEADAVLLGAVGGDKWNGQPPQLRPEQGLLKLRRELQLFANLRPLQAWPALSHASPLKEEHLAGVDFIIVRELTGGVYFGERKEGTDEATDICTYARYEVERIVRLAAEIAMRRSRKLLSVDKANVLATSRLWRATAERVVREEFPEVELKHGLVDSTAMHLIAHPRSFDVIVTENMFGDILSDESAAIVGSLGMLPSASCGAGKPAVFEPIHGSAPPLAGRNIANPYAAILSASLLLEQGLGLTDEAADVRQAVTAAIDAGCLPADLTRGTTRPTCSTTAVGDAVLCRLAGAAPASVAT